MSTMSKEEMKALLEKLYSMSETYNENITDTAYSTISKYKYITHK